MHLVYQAPPSFIHLSGRGETITQHLKKALSYIASLDVITKEILMHHKESIYNNHFLAKDTHEEVTSAIIK